MKAEIENDKIKIYEDNDPDAEFLPDLYDALSDYAAEHEDDCVNINVTNDGIGPYEYQGYRGFDHGTDYVEVNQHEPRILKINQFCTEQGLKEIGAYIMNPLRSEKVFEREEKRDLHYVIVTNFLLRYRTIIHRGAIIVTDYRIIITYSGE